LELEVKIICLLLKQFVFFFKGVNFDCLCLFFFFVFEFLFVQFFGNRVSLLGLDVQFFEKANIFGFNFAYFHEKIFIFIQTLSKS